MLRFPNKPGIQLLEESQNLMKITSSKQQKACRQTEIVRKILLLVGYESDSKFTEDNIQRETKPCRQAEDVTWYGLRVILNLLKTTCRKQHKVYRSTENFRKYICWQGQSMLQSCWQGLRVILSLLKTTSNEQQKAYVMKPFVCISFTLGLISLIFMASERNVAN